MFTWTNVTIRRDQIIVHFSYIFVHQDDIIVRWAKLLFIWTNYRQDDIIDQYAQMEFWDKQDYYKLLFYIFT